MTKPELVTAIAASAEITKTAAEKALQTVIDTISALKPGEDIRIAGLGTFTMLRRAAREGINPRNGETIQIAAQNTVRFKAGRDLKRAVNS